MMVIDGFAWPSRFQELLFSSSLLLLSTVHVEWLSFVVRPWHNYVPVDIDLNNLEDNLLLAHHNQEHAKQLVKRANRIAQRHLSKECMRCYVALLILEYADLLQ